MCELTVTMRDRSVVTMRSSSRPVEREVTQVIRRHLQLEAVGRLAVGGAHDARIVHEDVEPGMACEHLLGGRAHGKKVGQVEVEQFQGRALELALQLVAGPAALLVVAAGQDHVRPVLGQGACRLVPDATVRPRDQRDAARQVTDVGDAPGVSIRGLAARDRDHVPDERSPGSGRVEAGDLIRCQRDVGGRGGRDGRLGAAAAGNRDHP